MAIKRWIINEIDRKAAVDMSEKYNISSFLALILQSSGITSQSDILDFLSNDEPQFDPFSLKDMELAVERIRAAIDNNENIVIYGDYDADGVTATAVLYSYLLTYTENVSYYIPARISEGYGLNEESVRKLAEQSTNLIITVDNGISALAEARLAKELGIDMVITDHHKVADELPLAYAVVDPHRSDCKSGYSQLSGVGVAFMLICALENGENNEIITDNYSDLVTIGTIADLVPLVGINRSLVKRGLSCIANNSRVGIDALIKISNLDGKPITSGNIAFQVAPRINASGRMGTSDRSVELLVTEDYENAELWACEMENDNRSRQQSELQVFDEVMKKISDNPSLIKDRIIVVDGENWFHGVIGIVASRITSLFGKPSVIISSSDNEAKGSCRSIEGFSIFDALVASSALLNGFGGHTLAAGLTLSPENIDKFRTAMNRYAMENFPVMPSGEIRITCKLNPAHISVDMVEQIKLLEPFGTSNQVPVFGLFGMKINNIIPIGGRKHLKLVLSRDNVKISAMLFRVSRDSFFYSIGDTIDLAVTLELSQYKGAKSVSVFIRDIHLSGLDYDAVISGNSIYERCLRKEGNLNIDKASFCPDRNELAAVYRFLKSKNRYKGNIEILYKNFAGMSFEKFRFALEAMYETGLIDGEIATDILDLTVCRVDGKVDIQGCDIVSFLRGR